MGGYDGLALAMYDTNDQSFADKGADNMFSITITDASTVTSGYIQAFYANVALTGSITTASAQVNAFACDITLGGTISSEVSGLYVYITEAGSSTLTSADVHGVNVYIEELGGGEIISPIMLHKANTTAGTLSDAFIIMRLEGSAVATSMFEKAGTASNPTYFLKTNAVNNMVVTAYTPTSVTGVGLTVSVGGTDYVIPACAVTS